MNIPCPACGCACFAPGASSAVRRVRCPNCGKMIALQAREGEAVVVSVAPVVVSFSRTEQPSGVTRTLLLLDDGTTELREGDDVLVVGHAAAATVSSWRALTGSPALAFFAKAIVPEGETERTGHGYVLEIGDARHEWIGKLENPKTERVWSMLRGLWSTVSATPP